MSQRVDTIEEASDVIGDRRTVCCIGVFDGVHIGHQRLIGSAVAEARQRRKRSVVLTFRDHPLSLLAPAYAPPLLTDAREKARLLMALRPSLVVMVPFDHALADQEPEQFVANVLARRLRAVSVWCGPDFRFGREGRGDLHLLEQSGQPFEMTVHTIEPVRLGKHTVSSTWVRALIEEGQVEQAAECLGRSHAVWGEVAPGDRRGASLGYRTANVVPPASVVLPGDGVYAARIQTGKHVHEGVVHVGPLPTFDVKERRVEAHLLDFERDLLGKRIGIHFMARLRDVERFDSPEALVTQIRVDENQARRILNARQGE